MAPLTHDVQKIKGATSENDHIDAMCKQPLIRLICSISFVEFWENSNAIYASLAK